LSTTTATPYDFDVVAFTEAAASKKAEEEKTGKEKKHPEKA